MTSNHLLQLYGPMYGPLYFSTMLSTCFYGVACMQAFLYYFHYKNDHLRNKALVAIICAFNTIHEALIIAGTYKCIIAGMLDSVPLLRRIPELVIQLAFTSIVAVSTQGFFVHRIYVFNGKNIAIPLIYVLLGVYQLGSAFFYVWEAIYCEHVAHTVELDVFHDHFFMVMATSGLCVAVVADILISMFMTYMLLHLRCASTYVGTAHILQRLVVFAVNAGIWTSMFAFLSVILLHFYPTHLVCAVFAFPLCSIYCNTLLANLNARAYIRGEGRSCNTDEDLFMASGSRASEATRPRVASFRSGGVAEAEVLRFKAHSSSSENGGASVLPVVPNRAMTSEGVSSWV